jgi:multiple sugar transport system substrate-binding protein
MSKKLVSIVLVLAMCVVMLSACGSKDESEAGTTETNVANDTSDKDTEEVAKEEPVEINYMTFSAGPDHIEDLEAIIGAFEGENPNIKVNYEVLSWDAYFTRLQTLVAGGTAPDTFELNFENFVTYSENGTLLGLNDLISKDNVDLSVYNQRALEAFQVNGEQFGLVESFSNVVLYYNKELFDNAGVGYPEASWTWKEELEAAQKLTDVEAGVWGTYSPIQFWEFYKTIAQNGGAILSDDKTEVVINSPQNVETLQWMIDKIEKYKVTPSLDDMSGQSDGDLFVAGKIAMLRTGIWMFDAFMDAPFEWDIALEPGNTQKAHHFFANGVSVSKDTKNPEAAWKWIQFLTSSEFATQVRIDTGWELPAIENEDVLTGYLEKEKPASREVVFEALDSLVVPPVVDGWNLVTDVIGEQLTLASLGEKTAQEALDDAKVSLEELIK